MATDVGHAWIPHLHSEASLEYYCLVYVVMSYQKLKNCEILLPPTFSGVWYNYGKLREYSMFNLLQQKGQDRGRWGGAPEGCRQYGHLWGSTLETLWLALSGPLLSSYA